MNTIARRKFLSFLAASPLLSAAGAGQLLAAHETGDDGSILGEYLIKAPENALDVFDFRNVAR